MLMTKLFKKVSMDQIGRFSPELLHAAENLIAQGFDDLSSLAGSHPGKQLIMPAALAIGAFEGVYLPATQDARVSLNTTAPHLYGSLCAYAMAQAGDANALDLLSLIAHVPIVSHYANPIGLKWNRRGILHVTERVGMAACRYATRPDKGRELMEGVHESYRDLLGLDAEGIPSFDLCNNQSDFAIDRLVHDDLKGQIRRELKKRGPLDAQDILPYAGPLLVALVITQPQIWIEEGRDPEIVKNIIRRRVSGFWGMANFSYQIKDELSEVAIDAVLLPFPSLRRPVSDSYWGVSIETCRAMGSAKTLDVAKFQPLLLGGAMSMFKPMRAESTVQSADSFGFIATPEYANRMTGVPWAELIPDGWANRTGAWVMGKYKTVWPLMESNRVRESLFNWFLEHPGREPKHPLVPSYAHWKNFTQGGGWEQLFDQLMRKCPEAEQTTTFLHEYATVDPGRFDMQAQSLLSDGRKVRAHRALMPHITSDMHSFPLVTTAHRDRIFGSDLGL